MFLLVPAFLSAQTEEPKLEDLLDLGLRELTQIKITSVSKRAESLSDAPATVRVITEEQIRDRGYLTLDQALAELPGMQFRNPMSLNSYVFMRGVPSQNNLILVLIDGVEVNELNSGGFYGGGQYNLANVKRIEVVYGPASALYGTNAVSGIINLVTKDPLEDGQGLTVSGGTGGFGTALGNVQFAYKNPDTRFGLRISGMLKTSRLADLSGDQNDKQWSSDLELFETDQSLDVKLRAGDVLVGVNYQNRLSSAATYYPSTGTVYQDFGTRWNMRFLNVYVRHQKKLGETLSIQSRIYARETTVLDDSVREITPQGQLGFFRPNYRLGADLTLEANFNRKLNLVAGLVLENDWLATNYATSQSASPEQKPPSPSWPAMTEQFLFSSFAQVEYKPQDGIMLMSGVRLDSGSVTDVVVTPRAGAVFSLGDFSAKLLYGQAFRAPRPWDLSDGLGNPDLAPERMRSFEMSLGYRLLDNLRLEGVCYWNRLSNLFAREEIGTAAERVEWRWVNAGVTNTLGLELSAEMQWGALRSFVNYTHTRSVDAEDAAVAEVAAHGANLGVAYHVNRRIRASVWANVLGARPNPKLIAATDSRLIDSAVVLNASLSFLSMNGFDFQVMARNLLDEVYHHPSNRLPDRYRQPQCTVMVLAAYRF